MSSPTRKTGLNDRTHTHGKDKKPDEPKKGGGGRGAWGKEGEGSELYKSTGSDKNDPNYDSGDEQDSGFPPAIRPLDSYKQSVSAILKEYFIAGDANEVVSALKELDHPKFSHEVVKAAVSKALDLHDRERELASDLLSRLYPHAISQEKLVEGFTLLLQRIEDLKLDIPNAPEYLSMFLARAVVDDLLPPAFMSHDSADVELAKEVLTQARSLIQGKGASKRLAKIWGPAGEQSVKHLKERAQSILGEYLSSPDIAEAERAVREIKSDYFHWHVVKKAVLLALESKEADREKLIKLLQAFNKSQLVSETHFVAGFKCIVDMMGDIELDTPNAREDFRQFAQKSVASGYLPASFVTDNKEAIEAKRKAK